MMSESVFLTSSVETSSPEVVVTDSEKKLLRRLARLSIKLFLLLRLARDELVVVFTKSQEKLLLFVGVLWQLDG